eukprot:PhM_4_TR2007/c0_g1_i1/m.74752/K06173/truA, PUS1; tRNA pseudouridine38-40 synthase
MSDEKVDPRELEEPVSRSKREKPESPAEENANENNDGDAPTTTEQQGAKHRKTKIVLLIGYDGSPFHGMASNRDPLHPTVEETLYPAICKAGLISEMNQKGNSYQKIGWQRASRTDRGVHALRNIINLKIEEPDGGVDAIPALVQQYLNPDHIRIYGAYPTTRSFDCYAACTHRTYYYILPLYSLPGPEVFKQFPRFEDEAPTDDVIQRLLPCEPDEAAIKRAQHLFSLYLGTHSFHNFTPKGSATDPSMMRYITKAEFNTAEVLGRRVLKLELHGQAFMLHQIRKMVSVVLLVVNEGRPDSDLTRMLDKSVKQESPMLPSNGLILGNLYFGAYEAKLTSLKSRRKVTTDKPALDFTQWDDAVDAFAPTIYESCFRFETERRVMARWTLSTHYDQLPKWKKIALAEEAEKQRLLLLEGQSGEGGEKNEAPSNETASSSNLVSF